MRTRHRVLLVLLALCAFVVLAVGVAVVMLSRFAHVPAPVPAGWSAPASLPTSTPLPTTRFAFDSDRTGSFEIFTESTDGRAPAQLTRDDRYDSWSPDGSHLAWLTDFGGPGVGVWDVRIGDAQGRDPRRLFGDGGVTSRPEFSADSRSIFVHRVPPGGTKFDIYRIGVDGSGVTVVTAGQPGNNEYPSP